jgi:hypothetical protein
MGKHIKLFQPSIKLNEIVHGDLSDLTLKIFLPEKEIDITKLETNLNNILRLTTQFYNTSIFRKSIFSELKIDANFYKFTTDYTTHLLKELRSILEKFKLKIDSSKIEDSNLIIYLK